MPFDLLASPPKPPNAERFGDERPRRQLPLILPDIRFCDRQTRDVWRGMYTIRYEFMSLLDFDHITVKPSDNQEAVRLAKERGFPILRTAKVDSIAYREWLKLWHPAGKIFPHIQFGGAVEGIPGGDGGAGYAAWKLHALTLT